MKKTENIKIIKRCDIERQAAAEPDAKPSGAARGETEFVKTVKIWVREHRERKQRAAESARRLLGNFAPFTDGA